MVRVSLFLLHCSPLDSDSTWGKKQSFFLIMGKDDCECSLHKTPYLKLKVIYAAAVAFVAYRVFVRQPTTALPKMFGFRGE